MRNDKLTLKSLYEEFIQLEQDLSLFTLKVSDVFFWERIRFFAFQRLFNNIVVFEKENSTFEDEKPLFKNYVAKTLNYVKSIFMLRKNPFLTRRKDIIFLGSPRRKLQSDGKWWDIYTDHIIEKIDLKSVSIESDYSFQYFNPPKTKNLRYFTFLEFLVEIRRFLRLSSFKLTDEEKEVISLISDEMIKKFHYDIDLENLVINVLTRRKRILPFYLKILKKVKPKIVILVCSYGKENFIEACKIKGIPTVELQHGIISRYDISYNFEGENATKLSFPDYLFSFGEYWKKAVEYPIPNERVVNVGYPELDIQKEKLGNIQNKKQILFISQKPIGEPLSRLAAELDEEEIDYNIVYKLHPAESKDWKENYPWLLQSGVEVIDHLGKNLHTLFAESEVMIGVYSTAIYEGLNYGLRTYLLNVPGIEYMEELLKEEFVVKINSKEDILKKISSQSKRTFESDFFFISNSIENIKIAINKIIKS